MPHSFDDTARAGGLQPPVRPKGGRTDHGRRPVPSSLPLLRSRLWDGTGIAVGPRTL
jgi:hypothetical protein